LIVLDYGEHACSVLSATVPRSGGNESLAGDWIVGAITFTGMIHLAGGNTPGATVPDASAETPGAPALSAALPKAFAAGSRPPLLAQAEIGGDSFEAKWMALGHHDSAQPTPKTRDAPEDASNPASVTQDFRYLIYYVWSELPPPRSRRLSS
jgi:hypothetical protein